MATLYVSTSHRISPLLRVSKDNYSVSSAAQEIIENVPEEIMRIYQSFFEKSIKTWPLSTQNILDEMAQVAFEMGRNGETGVYVEIYGKLLFIMPTNYLHHCHNDSPRITLNENTLPEIQELHNQGFLQKIAQVAFKISKNHR